MVFGESVHGVYMSSHEDGTYDNAANVYNEFAMVGYPLADFAERVGSFARVYLNEERVEVNQLVTPTNDYEEIQQRRFSHKPGHSSERCFKKHKCEYCQRTGHPAFRCYKIDF